MHRNVGARNPSPKVVIKVAVRRQKNEGVCDSDAYSPLLLTTIDARRKRDNIRSFMITGLDETASAVRITTYQGDTKG
jgi:hypothetical protein